MEDKKDVTFADAKGTEANQHAKRLAKEKSRKELRAKQKYETFYTQKGTKVLKVTFKKNGQYQEYIGNMAKKKEAEMLKANIKIWEKDGIFVPEHKLEEFAAEKIAALNK